jgi:hypothetical protein
VATFYFSKKIERSSFDFYFFIFQNIFFSLIKKSGDKSSLINLFLMIFIPLIFDTD